MTSFCLQITLILYGNIAVFCLWKAMHAKNLAALLHKLTLRCLVKLYDVKKGMLFETTFFIRFIFGSISQPCILSSLCAKKMTSSTDPTK